MTPEERQIISATKDRLFSKGWRKFGWGDDGIHTGGGTSGTCLIAHIYRASEEMGLGERKYDVCKIISKELGLRYGIDLAIWNDHKNRTLDEVVSVLDRLLLRVEHQKESRKEVLVSTTTNREQEHQGSSRIKVSA